MTMELKRRKTGWKDDLQETENDQKPGATGRLVDSVQQGRQAVGDDFADETSDDADLAAM
jgi:hypothetical protein